MPAGNPGGYGKRDVAPMVTDTQRTIRSLAEAPGRFDPLPLLDLLKQYLGMGGQEQIPQNQPLPQVDPRTGDIVYPEGSWRPQHMQGSASNRESTKPQGAPPK